MSRQRQRWIAIALVLIVFAPIAVGLALNHRKQVIFERLVADRARLKLSPLVSYGQLSHFGVSPNALPILFWTTDGLSFSGHDITPEQMERIVVQANRLGSVRSVVVTSQQSLDARALVPLVRLKRLESLNLAQCNLHDEDLDAVSQVSQIRALNLDFNWELTADGVRHLAEIPHLQRLSLVGTSFRGSESIAVLQSMPSLREVRLGGNSWLLPGEKEQLDETLPGIDVVLLERIVAIPAW